MRIISSILKIPFLWEVSQKIFGDDKKKMVLYRSVIKGKGKILDFGCANGNTFPAFRNFNYYGFDTDKKMIINAKNKYHNYKNAKFFVVDILKQKSPEKCFEFVLFALTGHHMSNKKLLKVFFELSRLLNKGGRLYYFDSISMPKSDSFLLKIIMSMDQGKFIRTIKEYDRIRQLLPPNLKIKKTKYFQVTGTLMPQPKYLYWEMKKI